MSDMGSFYVPIAVEHPSRRGTLGRVEHVLVDTSSEFTWIPPPYSSSSASSARMCSGSSSPISPTLR